MAVGKHQPCAGYASQTEAVAAMMAEGLDRKAIVEQTGLKLGRVDTLMSLNRKRLKAIEEETAAWSPEKIEKARRLFQATMVLIAEALGVTVSALMTKVAPGARQPIQSDALPEPSREDDEAELAALEAAELEEVPAADDDNADPVANVGEGASGAVAVAADDPASREVDVVQHQAPTASGFSGAAAGGGEVTPPPPAALLPERPDVPPTAPEPQPGAPIFRLTRRGEYVDKSGVGSTRNIRHAWTGTARQIEAIYRRRPEFLEFDAEPVYA